MIIIFGGFSARANLALTVALRLHAELERRKITAPRKLADIISIYPRGNYAQSRGERRASKNVPRKPAKEAILRFLYRLFDASYLYPPQDLDRSYPYLFPGLAEPETLSKASRRGKVILCETQMCR
jgi:hypothetical protein